MPWDHVVLISIGAAVVRAVGDIGLVYAIVGAVTVALTLAFVPSPLGHAADYLTAEEQKAPA